MLTLENIGVEFGGRWLYRNSTIQVNAGDRIGLVGRNGTGKTTLLKLMTMEAIPTEGRVSLEKNKTIGFLRQELEKEITHGSVFEVAREAFNEMLALKKQADELEKKLHETGDPELAVKIADIQMHLHMNDGDRIDVKTHETLSGLGFSEADQSRPYTEFSGGWRMRVMLARLLLRRPDLLLLDEPTNHLDLPAILWLEGFLSTYPGAVIVVSHDKFFLDKIIRRTVEITGKKLYFYKGNYSFYLMEKNERRDLQQREYDNQQKFIYDAERFIERFRAKASKASQAQSRIKMLENLERIEQPEPEESSVHFNFQPSIQPGRQLFDIHIEQKKFDNKVIFENCTGALMRGDKVALIGANGLGKSTLLKMLMDKEPFEGKLTWGHNAMPAFFAQHQLDQLNPAYTILEQMEGHSRKKGETFVRNILGGFLFSGDDTSKKISVLSGGEKSRVALANTLLTDSNCLLLDEPTNHLDITSISVLIRALQDYTGSFVVVSHDRWFLSEVANKIWYIEDKKLKEYPGRWADYEYFLEQRKSSQTVVKKSAPVVVEKVVEKKFSYHEEKEKKKKIRNLEDKIEKAEAEIARLENKKAELHTALSDPAIAADFAKLSPLMYEFEKLERDLEKVFVDWDQLLKEKGEADK